MARPVPVPLTREEFIDRYVTRGQTLDQIAAELGVSPARVRKAAIELGVPRRPSHRRPLGPLGDRDWLHREYVEAGRSSYDIAIEVGCTPKSVSRALRRHGIPVRGRPGSNDAQAA